MFRALIPGVLAMALLFGPAQAQDAADDSAEREALAQRYIQLSTGDHLDKVLADLGESIVATYPEPAGPEAQWMRQQLPAFSRSVIEQLAAAMAPLYAERMTLEELTALVEFYDTPLGRGILRKDAELALEIQPTMDAIALAEAEKLLSKFCAEFDCTSAVPLAPAKS